MSFKAGPMIARSQNRIEWLDVYPYNRTWIEPVSSGVPYWTLAEVKQTQKRVKPLDLTNSVTAYASERVFHSNGVFTRPLDGQYGPSTYTAPRVFPNVNEVNRLKEMAGSAFRTRVRDEKMSVPTTLAEMPETVKWIAKSARDMYDAYLYVKKGRWLLHLPTAGRKAGTTRNAERPIFRFTHRDGRVYEHRFALDKRLSKRYLEWRFAVQPIVSDLQSFLDEYHSNMSKPIIRRVTATVSGSFNQENPYWASTHNMRVTAGSYFTMSINGEVKNRYGINALSTLWELAPLSFLVDQFLPVGTYLLNRDADYGVSYRGRWLSTHEYTEVRSIPLRMTGINESVSTCTVKSYVRETSFPSEQLPRFRQPRDILTTSLDVLALARSYVR